MKISQTEVNFVNSDGLSLFGRIWFPDLEARAVVYLVHGIGDHSGRFEEWAHFFCRRGVVVAALDYRGHGNSKGKRGHINKIKEFLDDIDTFIAKVGADFLDLPSFIYGHSMGGNLVLTYLMQNNQNFSGAVVTSPWIGLVNPPSLLTKWLAAHLDKVLPTLTLSTRIRSSQLSSQPQAQQNAKSDPLMHSRISLRLFNQLNLAAEHLIANPAKITLPLLVLHGSADRVTCPKHSAEFSSKCKTSVFKEYEGALHELHNESVKSDVFEHVMQWMESIMLNKEEDHGAIQN
jgi:alpha-beta hydrolase superfamily lysophospholipase